MEDGGEDDRFLIGQELFHRAPEMIAHARRRLIGELESAAPVAERAWRAAMWTYLDRGTAGDDPSPYVGGPAWDALRAAIHRPGGWPEGSLFAFASGLREMTRQLELARQLREEASHRRDRRVYQRAGELGQWRQYERVRDAVPLVEQLAKAADALAEQLENPLIRAQVRRLVLHRSAVTDPATGQTHPQAVTVEDVLAGELRRRRGPRPAPDVLDGRAALLQVLTEQDKQLGAPFGLTLAHAVEIVSDAGPRFVRAEERDGARNPWTADAIMQVWSRVGSRL